MLKSHCNVAAVVPTAWYCIVEYGVVPVCNAHHTPTPLDTVVRRANGMVVVPAPVLMVAVVAVDTTVLAYTIAATLMAVTASAVPAVTL